MLLGDKQADNFLSTTMWRFVRPPYPLLYCQLNLCLRQILAHTCDLIHWHRSKTIPVPSIPLDVGVPRLSIDM
jgi:hypothetical protein